MLRLLNHIKIFQADGTILQFPIVNNVTITRSFDNQTQTATVTLPRNFKYNEKNIYEGDNPIVKRGEKIELYGGYAPNLKLLFSGYISKIDNNVPMVLKCEDEMWVLKQKQAPNLSYKSVNLRTFISKVLEGTNIPFNALDADLGQIRTQNASIGKILQVLRDDYGLYSYIIKGTLYVGLPFQKNLATEQYFLFEKQMITDGMDLQYLKKEDVNIKIKAVIIGKDNKRQEYVYLYQNNKIVSYDGKSKEFNNSEGDVRTVFQYGGTKEQLDVKVNSFLVQSNYTGYYGSFMTFLEPSVVPGDYAIIDSYMYPERKGTYLIKSVETSFGVDGGRQKIELERKLA
jgi:hypothetical protein